MLSSSIQIKLLNILVSNYKSPTIKSKSNDKHKQTKTVKIFKNQNDYMNIVSVYCTAVYWSHIFDTIWYNILDAISDILDEQLIERLSV